MTKKKNNVGRPLRFKNKEELQDKINEYLNNLPTYKKVITNKISLDIPIPTITGLAYHLGFESRQSFYDYESYEEFSYTIKRARLFIESEYEKQLQIGNTTGAIFALKNMGWIDKTTTDNEHRIVDGIDIKSLFNDKS